MQSSYTLTQLFFSWKRMAVWLHVYMHGALVLAYMYLVNCAHSTHNHALIPSSLSPSLLFILSLSFSILLCVCVCVSLSPPPLQKELQGQHKAVCDIMSVASSVSC